MDFLTWTFIVIGIGVSFIALLFAFFQYFNKRGSPKKAVVRKSIFWGLSPILIFYVLGLLFWVKEQETTDVKNIRLGVEQYRNPGFSLHMIISIHHLPVSRRKYLFDFGHTNRERLSIYLSAGNVFTFSLIDANGEPYPFQVPLGTGGIPTSQPIYLICEAGVSSNSTSLRVFVNAQSVGEPTMLPFRVNLGDLDLPGGVIGSDLNGNDGASFDLYELAIYGATLTDEQIAQLAEYSIKRPRTNYVAFDGNKWMRLANFKNP